MRVSSELRILSPFWLPASNPQRPRRTPPTHPKHPAGSSHLAALAGADTVVVPRGFVLAHEARLVDAGRGRRGRGTGHHLLGAGALGLHRYGQEERQKERKKGKVSGAHDFISSRRVRTSRLKCRSCSWVLARLRLVERRLPVTTVPFSNVCVMG